ncbi:MAG: DoxX family membrane protein [Patescibacteria group bacterium]
MPQATSFDQFTHATSHGFFSGCVFLLRILMGFFFLHAGWSKIATEAWTAAPYLSTATGPFASWFQSLAGNGTIDMLNMYGLFLIGLALLLGLLVRPAAAFGILLMVLYYFAQFTQNTAHGFIDQHLIIIGIFLLFLSGGFGHIWGIDGLVSRQPYLQGRNWLKFLHG